MYLLYAIIVIVAIAAIAFGVVYAYCWWQAHTHVGERSDYLERISHARERGRLESKLLGDTDTRASASCPTRTTAYVVPKRQLRD